MTVQRTRRGIDVSDNQKVIGWGKVKAAASPSLYCVQSEDPGKQTISFTTIWLELGRRESRLMSTSTVMELRRKNRRRKHSRSSIY